MRETNYYSFGKVSLDIANAKFEILHRMALPSSVAFLFLFLSYLEVLKDAT
jgi:hypothetical protein